MTRPAAAALENVRSVEMSDTEALDAISALADRVAERIGADSMPDPDVDPETGEVVDGSLDDDEIPFGEL